MHLNPRIGRQLSLCVWLSVACTLSACARSAPLVADAPTSSIQVGGTCNLADVQFVMGKTVDERLAEEARHRSGARVVRVLRPEQAATLEFNPSRLNLRADKQGIVITADCG